jgi:hypothetical protein
MSKIEAERKFAENALVILDANTVVEIVKHLTPLEVLALCRIEKFEQRFCNDSKFFGALMRYHYPDFPLAIPGQVADQYKEITTGDAVKYHIKYVKEDFEVIASDGVRILMHFKFMDQATKIDHFTFENDVNFAILAGNRLASGTKLWLVIIVEPADQFPIKSARVFPSKKAAIDEFIEKTLIHIERSYVKYGHALLRAYTDEELNFEETMKFFGFPSPFNGPTVRKYIEANNFFVDYPRNTHPAVYYFTEFTLNN